MTGAGRRLVAWLAAGLVGGLIVGWAAFALTATHQPYGYLGPLCRSESLQDAGFSPWTGEPVPNIYVCEQVSPEFPPTHVVTLPLPDDLVGRRAIPVPVGFAVGFAATPIILWLWDRRRRADTRAASA